MHPILTAICFASLMCCSLYRFLLFVNKLELLHSKAGFTLMAFLHLFTGTPMAVYFYLMQTESNDKDIIIMTVLFGSFFIETSPGTGMKLVSFRHPRTRSSPTYVASHRYFLLREPILLENPNLNCKKCFRNTQRFTNFTNPIRVQVLHFNL